MAHLCHECRKRDDAGRWVVASNALTAAVTPWSRMSYLARPFRAVSRPGLPIHRASWSATRRPETYETVATIIARSADSTPTVAAPAPRRPGLATQALQRLEEIVEEASYVAPVRKATKPTYGSKQRRLKEKAVRAQVKAGRRCVDD